MMILENSYQKLEKDEKEFNMNLMNGLICHCEPAFRQTGDSEAICYV